jgi:hypothetical protein
MGTGAVRGVASATRTTDAAAERSGDSASAPHPATHTATSTNEPRITPERSAPIRQEVRSQKVMAIQKDDRKEPKR